MNRQLKMTEALVSRLPVSDAYQDGTEKFVDVVLQDIVKNKFKFIGVSKKEVSLEFDTPLISVEADGLLGSIKVNDGLSDINISTDLLAVDHIDILKFLNKSNQHVKIAEKKTNIKNEKAIYYVANCTNSEKSNYSFQRKVEVNGNFNVQASSNIHTSGIDFLVFVDSFKDIQATNKTNINLTIQNAEKLLEKVDALEIREYNSENFVKLGEVILDSNSILDGVLTINTGFTAISNKLYLVLKQDGMERLLYTVNFSSSDSIIDATSVVVSPNPITLDINETQILTIDVLPLNASQLVNAVVSNPSIVSYNSVTKQVTGLQVGTTTITLTSDSTPSIFTTLTVNVISGGGSIINPTSISVNPNPITLTVGESKTLTIDFLPLDTTERGNSISVANKSIVTFDGQLHGIAEGSTTITATSSAVPAVQQVVDVTVTAGGNVGVTSLSIDGATRDMTVSNATGLVVWVIPSNATNQQVTASIVDDTIVSVTTNEYGGGSANFGLTALKVGSTVVNFTSVDNPSATTSITVNVTA